MPTSTFIPGNTDGLEKYFSQLKEYFAYLKNIAYRIKHEEMIPVYTTNFHGNPIIKLVPKQEKMNPEIFLIEEYEMKSVLGDYGAGKVIKTMNFGPNEERTISVSSYKKRESTKSFSKNVLDSFSEESAEELESMVENESSTNTSNTTQIMKSAEVSASVSAGFGPFSGSAGGGSSSSKTSNSSREEMARQLSTAMDKHTAKSSSNREVEVNDTTTETVSEGSEESTTRVLKNPNFKTMNLVMRQMEQEYITAIIMNDVKIGFCNGTKESVRYAKLFELDQLLDDVIEKDKCKEKLKCTIIKSLMRVRDMVGNTHEFIEEVEEPEYECYKTPSGKTRIRRGNDTIRYWRKNKKLTQKLSDVRPDLSDFIVANGIILDVKVRVLRTDGVIADAFLGHGETLDCFNQKLQDEATKTEILRNEELGIKNKQEELKLKIIDSISDPTEKVAAFQKLFLEKCLPQDIGQQ